MKVVFGFQSHIGRALMIAVWIGGLLCSSRLHAQPNEGPGFPPPDFGPGGPPFGGPPGGGELKVVAQFDKDGDKRLNADERKLAREFVKKERAARPGRGPRRPPGEPDQAAAQPGTKMAPADAKSFPKEPLFASNIVRTLFLSFDNPEWEKELSDFNNTDVEVPAKVVVDGKSYEQVGVHFRGATSFMMVGEGRKRPLNLSFDHALKKQSLHGVRTLNLLNAHEDPSFLRTVLYSHIAREYIPAPRANFMRVVINGEYWGIYTTSEQFNKDFTEAFFGSSEGARWKVPGSPRGGGGLAYLGDEVEKYKRVYEIKTKDDAKSWANLVKLCKTLNETPSNELVKALSPMLDIDGTLKFLALENALINNDGYWIRTSDYNLYQDNKGVFHLIPHDMNETFARPGGPGFGGPGGRRQGRGSNFVARADGPAGNAGGPGEPPRDVIVRADAPRPTVNGVELDPLVAANDASKPLISKLLAVPELRDRYLGYVRDIAERWLDWNKLGPIASSYHGLIEQDVKLDTRKLSTFDDFKKSLTEDIQGRGFGPGGGTKLGLKNFADQRRAYLLRVTSDARSAH